MTIEEMVSAFIRNTNPKTDLAKATAQAAVDAIRDGLVEYDPDRDMLTLTPAGEAQAKRLQ